MLPYGKTAGNALAAMSYLAKDHGIGLKRSSKEIGEARNLSQALVGKLLVSLSQAGLVKAVPGPNGGYLLARPPEKITLLEIVQIFERMSGPASCPFGPEWCGKGAPCPLHDKLVELYACSLDFLKETNLSVFATKEESEHA